MPGEPITMVRHAHKEGRWDWPAGHFAWGEPQADASGVYRYCHMVLPSKVPSLCSLPVREGTRVQGYWWWNGDLDKPTFRESIHHDPHNLQSDHNWHGFVTKGVMRLDNRDD
jgi:Family of unknown function (DUF6527)